ncbi:MAG: haloacid dehalogenase, partial [Sphingomonas bacterium]|nr:haloacid dehalogenase [Sphingomonas bacterium]
MHATREPSVPGTTGSRTADDEPSCREARVVAEELAVDPAVGLSSDEARRRAVQYGPNQLRASNPPPLWRRILAQFQDPLVYLLLGAVVVALAAWAIEGQEDWPVDAVVIAAVLLLNAAIGFAQESKAANAVAALARMTAVTSSVLRDGERQRIPSAGIVPGDVLLLDEGDAVGADARLVTAAVLRIQEASLTGESEAVLKNPD